MPNDTMKEDDMELEMDLKPRAEAIESLVAFLDLGVNGDGESLPTRETIRAYLRHLEREVRLLRQDLKKIDHHERRVLC